MSMSVKILSTEVVFRGHFEVRRDVYELESRKKVIYDYVDGIRAVMVLPILDSRIVMLKQYRHPLKKVVYDLPAGGINTYESPKAAARRELQEETGFATTDLEDLGTFHHIPGAMNSTLYLYAARNLTPGASRLDPTEELEIVTVPMDQFESLINEHSMEAAVPLAYYLYMRKTALYDHNRITYESRSPRT